MNVRLLSTFITLFLALPSPARAAEPVARIQGLSLIADDLFRDTERETVELAGRVQIVYKDQHIQSEKATIDLRGRKAELSGNVRITTPKSTIGGQRVSLDYENGTGVIYDGYVQSGQVIFEGAVLQKTGADEYYVLQADYTTCTNCPASWSFRGTSIRAELGGYAYIRNSVLKIGSLSVLWLPYLIVPLKSDRQTGLLTPGIEHAEADGLTYSQPFFWAISRSTDATITLKNYELRGLKGLVNYRYMLAENSSGELDFGGLRDRVFQNDNLLNRFRPAERQGVMLNRWFMRYQHHHETSDGWIHRALLNNASDLQYANDFPTETGSFLEPAMENRISMTNNSRSSHLRLEAGYYINMLQADPIGGNEDAVHRVPEIHYSILPRPLGTSGFSYALDLDYTNFTRSGPAYDNLTLHTVNGSPMRTITSSCTGNEAPRYGSEPRCQRQDDGKYDPATDLLRTGQRFDFQPTLLRPLRVAEALELIGKASYRETHYNFPVGPESNNVRRYLRAELGGRGSFSRIYGDLDEVRSTRYRHEIRPELTYTAVPWIEHRSHPFFGFSPQTEAPTFESLSVNNGDLAGNAGLQFDYRDRLYDRNLLTYALVNTVTEKRWLGDTPSYRQVAMVRVAQSYDAWKDSQSDPNKQPWSDISTLVDLRFDRVQTYTLFNHFPYQKVTNTSARVRVVDDRGRFAQLGVANQFTIVPGQEVDRSTRVEDYTLGAGFGVRYLDLMGKVVYNANATDDNNLKSWAYIAQFKPPGECWIISLVNYKNTGRGPVVAIDFNFFWDGAPKAPLPADTLDLYGL